MQQSTQEQVNVRNTVYENRYVILAIVLTGILMSVLDGYMMSIALPTITTYFNVSVVLSQWIVTGYLVVMTCLFVVFGKLSEYTGKVKLFLAGWTIFTAASFACSLASGIDMLIAFRVIQAIGASMVAGVSGAILFQAFPPKEIGRAMGYFGSTVALGGLIGPGLGGLITDKFGWQYIFLVNVPIGIALLAVALKYLKVPEAISKKLEMDWIGAGSLFVSVASLMLFCMELANGIAVTIPMAAYGAVFVLSLAAFLMWESRCRTPILDLSLLRGKKFSLPVLSLLLSAIALNTSAIIGPFYFEGVMGYDVSQVGLLFMLVPLATMVVSPTGGWLYDKYHWKYMATGGVLLSAASYLILGYAYMTMNFGLAIIAMLAWGAGYGIFTSPNSTETMSAVPREKTAIASSVSTTARSLGGALGVSFASIFLTAGLARSGYGGSVMQAGPSLLANTIGLVMIAAGILCIVSAAASALRNISKI